MSEQEIATQLVTKLHQQVIQPLNSSFVGKKQIIDLLAVVAISGENLLLIGPPGTAKSQIVQSFSSYLQGRYFECLLTRFSEPNELLGTIDLQKLREGRVEVNTSGMLPDAEFAFIDEVFNGNSAILNSLLNILNERTFRRGHIRQKLDLQVLVGASNTLPKDSALMALLDRFLVRVQCSNLPEEQMQNLLEIGWKKEQTTLMPTTESFSVAQLRQLNQFVFLVDIEEIKQPYQKLVQQIRKLGILFSDRRIVKTMKLIAAASLYAGRMQATPIDFWVLKYVWDLENQIDVLEELIQETIHNYLSTVDEKTKKAESAALSSHISLAEIGQEFYALLDVWEKKTSELERVSINEKIIKLQRKFSWVTPKNEKEEKQLQILLEQVKKFLEESSDE